MRRHGPLWTHSLFEYESINGYLRRQIHGTHDIEKQVNPFKTICVVFYCLQIAAAWIVQSDSDEEKKGYLFSGSFRYKLLIRSVAVNSLSLIFY